MKKIRKIAIYGLALIFALSFSFSFLSTAQAETVDQYCTGPWGGWSKIKGHSDVSQTFVPTQNRLTRVMLVLRGDGDGTVYVRIMKDGSSIAGASVSEPNGDETFVYADFDDVNLTPGDTYRLKLTTADYEVGWYRSNSSGCCDSGSAYMDGTQKDYDWGFGTYGFTYTPPEDDGDGEDSQPEEQTDDGSDTNTENDQVDNDSQAVSQGDNQAPSQNVDSSIDPPSNLKAADVKKDQGGKIELSWKKSETSSIDGYKIFRAKSKEGDYKNIAKTEDSVLKYTDSKLKNDQPYFYLIRAYNGQKESASSNKVKATAVDNLSPEAPANFKIINQFEDRLIFSWDGNEEEDLSGYMLKIYSKTEEEKEGDFEMPIKSIKIGVDETEYMLVFSEHDEINQESQYEYYLQASDTSNNLSDRAGPVFPNLEKEQSTNRTAVWYISLAVLVILLIVLGGLIYWERKKGKKKKIKVENKNSSTKEK